MKGLLGKKIGMTEIFNVDGDCIPVTLLQVGPCFITKVQMNSDDEQILQLGFGDKNKVNKPMAGSFKFNKGRGFEYISEVPCSSPSQEEKYKIGDQITIAIFDGIKTVDIMGTSKGKGFTGTVKRHNFSGGPKTHGHRHVLRSAGSTGACAYPGRVFKGKKMAGRSGNARVTLKNIELLQIEKDKNLLVVKGCIPGKNGGFVRVIESD